RFRRSPASFRLPYQTSRDHFGRRRVSSLPNVACRGGGGRGSGKGRNGKSRTTLKPGASPRSCRPPWTSSSAPPQGQARRLSGCKRNLVEADQKKTRA